MFLLVSYPLWVNLLFYCLGLKGCVTEAVRQFWKSSSKFLDEGQLAGAGGTPRRRASATADSLIDLSEEDLFQVASWTNMSRYAMFDSIFPCARGTESMLALPLVPVFKNIDRITNQNCLIITGEVMT